MKKKILLIEDEHDLVQVMKKRLLVAGYEVMISQDAVIGTSEAHAFKPDLIILDLMIPAGGGHLVLSRLESASSTSNIPVLVITAMRDEATKKKIMDLGVAGYMEKPFEIEDVLSEIKKILV